MLIVISIIIPFRLLYDTIKSYISIVINQKPKIVPKTYFSFQLHKTKKNRNSITPLISTKFLSFKFSTQQLFFLLSKIAKQLKLFKLSIN